MFNINIDIVGTHQELTIHFDTDLYFPIAYVDEFNNIINRIIYKSNCDRIRERLTYELQYFFTKLYDKGNLGTSKEYFDLDEELVHIEKSDHRENKINQENYNQEFLSRMRKREEWVI